jgi:hypothetical protein
MNPSSLVEKAPLCGLSARDDLNFCAQSGPKTNSCCEINRIARRKGLKSLRVADVLRSNQSA